MFRKSKSANEADEFGIENAVAAPGFFRVRIQVFENIRGSNVRKHDRHPFVT